MRQQDGVFPKRDVLHTAILSRDILKRNPKREGIIGKIFTVKGAVLMPRRAVSTTRPFLERVITGNPRRSAHDLLSDATTCAEDGRLSKPGLPGYQIGKRAALSAY